MKELMTVNEPKGVMVPLAIPLWMKREANRNKL